MIFTRLTDRVAFLAIAMIGLCTVSARGGAQTLMQAPPLVRQVDHLLLSSSRAKELFGLFAETFQFPIVWALSDQGGFASGGVALGNVNAEILSSR